MGLLPSDPTKRGAASRRILLLVLLVLAVSGAFRLVDLGRFQESVFDEYYYVHDARVLLRGDLRGSVENPWQPTALRSTAHPDLAKLAIAGGILVFGDNPWGWRVPPALAGLALLALVYPLARRLGLSPAWSFAALLLAASDPLLILESRIAVLDSFVAFFTVLAVLVALRSVQGEPRFAWLLLCGASLGLAVASKWSGCLTLLALVLILVADRRSRGRWAFSPVRLAVALLLVPAAVYLAAAIPYFVAGHGLGDFWRLQLHMATFGWNVQGTLSFASPPISWPFLAVPIWYKWMLVPRGVVGLLAIGNPPLWWGGSLACLVLCALAIRRRTSQLILPVLLAFSLYLPWLITTRQTYLYYMVPVVPFLAIVLAGVGARFAGELPEAASLFAEGGKGRRESARRRVVAWTLCLLCAAVGFLYVPFAMGFPVPFAYYSALTPLVAWR